ncbi:hypothetical protein [Ornithobacterium rhinotracheale]|uniref:hypothetical protein n=1 Tax=Ornithobacterium rhinotracheale TaxID=28251 RepID=UPI001FF0F9E1|nr:hypothetical protein [Ornithobacterium rhinotracheale]MCK0199153.1 hypothetical protein [Ornithobacterium rhinotracheale]
MTYKIYLIGHLFCVNAQYFFVKNNKNKLEEELNFFKFRQNICLPQKKALFWRHYVTRNQHIKNFSKKLLNNLVVSENCVNTQELDSPSLTSYKNAYPCVLYKNNFRKQVAPTLSFFRGVVFFSYKNLRPREVAIAIFSVFFVEKMGEPKSFFSAFPLYYSVPLLVFIVIVMAMIWLGAEYFFAYNQIK